MKTSYRSLSCTSGPRSAAAALLLGIALLISGCVSNKYQAASALGAQPQRMGIYLGGGPELKTRLDAVIIYQGQGSWKKAAFWDELLVNIVNESGDNTDLTPKL